MPVLPAPARSLIEAVVAAAIPRELAAYVRPVAHALVRFIELLPPRRAAAILREQVAQPADTAPGQRLALLAHRCPTLHKLAQVLARDRRLDPALRRDLQRLESLEPRTSLARLLPVLRTAIGDPARKGLALENCPLAEASVASIVPFTWTPPGQREPRRGVLKILRPGVGRRLRQELEILTRIGSELDDRCDDLGLPPLEYKDTFERVQETLEREIHFDAEQRHLGLARAQYARDPGVWIPAVWPELCAGEVTAMERIDGPKVTEATGRLAGSRLAPALVEALLAQPFWNADPAPLFHGDPHAGNILAAHDGRLGLIDWSLAAPLPRALRRALARLILAALLHDPPRLAAALSALGDKPPDPARIDRVAMNALRSLRGGQLPGFDWLINVLDAAVQHGGLQVSAEMLLFRKALWTLEGVVADLAGHEGLDLYLLPSFLRGLSAEWPTRLLAPPGAAAPLSQLSIEDIAGLLVEMPAVPLRILAGWLEDCLDPPGNTPDMPAAAPP